MVRTGDVPTAWANDGQFHDFDWTPASAIYNPGANHCTITPGTTYNLSLLNSFTNAEYLLATDVSGTPYMINSIEPADLTFPAPATPYPPGVVWQSAPSHAEEIPIYSASGAFNGTRPSNTVPLGVWTGPDFTTDASTTVHIWSRHGASGGTVLDIGLAASSGGNPYTAHPDRVGNLIYGYPNFYSPTSAGWISGNAPEAATVQEQVLTANWNVTIHHGDELWGFLYPSFAGNGDNAIVGGMGNIPQYQICEGDCNSIPLQTATVTAPVIIIPGIVGSAQHNGVWVIDPITHGFDNLIDTLLANGFTQDVNLFTFPYDWHKSNVDTAILLKQKIDAVKAICHCDKVDLVAHSMGGLVARQYIQSSNYDHDVRNMTFMGTPHLGDPEDYLMWEGGERDPSTREGRVTNILMRNQAFEAGYRNVSGSQNIFDYIHNAPVSSVQELLPIYNYLENTGVYAVSRADYPTDYPRNTFLENLDANIDNLRNSDIKVSNFVGQLANTNTIERIRVVPPSGAIFSWLPRWSDGFPENFGNIFTNQGLIRGQGDELVPLSSAEFEGQNITILKTNHGGLITESEGSIFKILTGKDATALITNKSYVDPYELIIQIFSPADIVVIAPDGKRVGKNFSTGDELSEIAGSFYSGYQTNEEFITIPNPLDGEYKVLTQGTGSGAYTIGAAYADSATSSEKFITGETSPGLVTEHDVTVDTNHPEALNIKFKDVTPPTISILKPIATTYSLHQVVIANYSCSDDLSGVSQCVGPVATGTAIDTGSIGIKSFTINASDVSGNTSFSTVKYIVGNYIFGGFGPNLVMKKSDLSKASSIPVKFQLFGTDGVVIPNAVAILKVNGAPAVSTSNSNTGNQFRYDSANKQYIFNLSTKQITVGTNALLVTFDDGVTKTWTVTIQ